MVAGSALRLGRSRLRARRLAALLGAGAAIAANGCKGGGASGVVDGAGDGAGETALRSCPDIDVDGGLDDGGGGAPGDDAAAGVAGWDVDEFGPHAAAAKTASSLGRVNIYEVTSPRLLQRLDIYLRMSLDQTRLTIGVFEATGPASAFQKIAAIQLDAPAGGGPCQGWVTSGPLAIPLEPGRFYMAGFDPSQPVTPFVTSDTETLPVDGAFGRLVSSKTTTSVSVPSIGWDKVTDKEYNRQRLMTSPRAGAPAGDGGAADGGGGPTDGGPGDARDAPRG